MVNLYENKDKVINDSIDRVVVELFNKKENNQDSQIILMTGCSSAAGTTSMSIAMAIAIANTHRKTLLVDCDVRKASKYKKLNESVELGLADHLEGDKDIDSVICDTNIENLMYLPCGVTDKNPTRLLCSLKMKEMLENLKKQYDYIVLDLPSISIAPDAFGMFDLTDGIIYIAAIGETTKLQIKQAKKKLLSYEDKYYGMLINKVEDDEFKSVMRNYDYYFSDETGEQKLVKKSRTSRGADRSKNED